MNPFYNPTGNPAANSAGLSTLIRGEFNAISAAFTMMPRITTIGLFDTIFSQSGSYTYILPPKAGTLALLTDVVTEAARATGVETTRALAAEGVITTSVTAEATARSGAVSTETARAQAAEGALSTNISTVTTSVTAEVNRATAAETTGVGLVNSEATTRAAAVSGEITRAQNAEAALNAAVANKQNALGYAPVQQGTGIGQIAANVVKIGWTGSQLAATVDVTDMGAIVTTTMPNGFALASTVNAVLSFLPSKNIAGWGVTGSGLDETAKCQQAIDDCAGKYTLVFPAYLPQIVITGLRYHSGSSIQIDGTLFLKSGSFTHMFCGDDAGVHVVRFSGSGTLNGNQAGNNGSSPVGINPYCGGIVTTGYSTAATVSSLPNSDIIITGLHFINITNWPVSIFCCDKAFITHCRFYMYGNSVQVANGTRNFGVYFNDCEQTGDYAISAYQGCQGGEIAFNNSRYVAADVGVLNDGKADAQFWASMPNHDITIHHNRSRSTYTYGVGVLNVATLTATPGVVNLASNNYDIDVSDNIIIDSGIADTQNNAAGVYIVRSRVRVRGNRIRWGGTAGALWYGIGGTNSDRCTFDRNEISNGGILSDGTTLAGCTAVGLCPSMTNTVYRLNEIFDDQAAPTMSFAFGYGYSFSGAATDTILAGCQWLFQTVKGMKVQPYKAAQPFAADTVVFSPSENITSTIAGKLAVVSDIHSNSATIDGVLTTGSVQSGLVNGTNITAVIETVSETATIGNVSATQIAVSKLNTNGVLTMANLVQAVSDADAAIKGIGITQLYLNGSQLLVRQA